MNREIKFRAYSKSRKKFLDDIYIVITPDGRISAGKESKLHSYGQGTITTSEYYESEDLIIQQYTGLRDRNDKEIYEGDIVFRESYQADYIVKFENFRYLIEDVVCHGTKDAYRTDMISELSADLMIIGNIFENKDLLL